MTDNGNGTYEADFMVSASSGTVSIVVEGVQGGLDAEYFTNRSWSGAPAITQIDDQIDFNWGHGNITPLSVSNNASVKWTGVVIPPSAGTYTFTVVADDWIRLTVDGDSVNGDAYGGNGVK